MKQTSFAEIISLAERAGPLLLAGAADAVGQAAVRVQATAQKKFGVYQPQVGPFPAWQPLAESTVAEKLRAGAEGDDPLIGHYQGPHEYLSGNNIFDAKGQQNEAWPTSLRRSIEIARHNPLLAEVGTNDPIGLYQELGTSRIPPRPFMRPAGYEEGQELERDMAGVVVAVFFEGGGP